VVAVPPRALSRSAATASIQPLLSVATLRSARIASAADALVASLLPAVIWILVAVDPVSENSWNWSELMETVIFSIMVSTEVFNVVISVISLELRVTLTPVIDKDKEVIDSDSRDIVSSAKKIETLLMSVIPSIDSPEVLVEVPAIAVVRKVLTFVQEPLFSVRDFIANKAESVAVISGAPVFRPLGSAISEPAIFISSSVASDPESSLKVACTRAICALILALRDSMLVLLVVTVVICVVVSVTLVNDIIKAIDVIFSEMKFVSVTDRNFWIRVI